MVSSLQYPNKAHSRRGRPKKLDQALIDKIVNAFEELKASSWDELAHTFGIDDVHLQTLRNNVTNEGYCKSMGCHALWLTMEALSGGRLFSSAAWKLKSKRTKGHTSLIGLLSLKDTQLVTASADSTLKVWDAETGQCRGTLACHTGAITCFDHDHEKIISGSDRSLKLWDAKTTLFEKDLLTDLCGVWQVAFDARRCVAAVQREGVPTSTYIDVSTPMC
ncbi:hypothetical protein N7450_011610 [Penicillium hetheringtonii]|uniref:Mitochondrial division protein 1 n=1 Tax=Penicillium hetheringtonii TaxID=911720 RepID=A0AAD6DA83_9EURO|nr:hypothetical protein N7450_011610 [Penicillium hetheringtonii]